MQKIAVIEDAKDNRDLLYYLLCDEFDVIRYSTGEEALRHLPHDKPDLIITDIWLGAMDGVDVLHQIRKDASLCKARVVALTAHAMMGDREKYLAAGFDEYVAKPIVDIQVFVATLRRLLNGRV